MNFRILFPVSNRRNKTFSFKNCRIKNVIKSKCNRHEQEKNKKITQHNKVKYKNIVETRSAVLLHFLGKLFANSDLTEEFYCNYT